MHYEQTDLGTDLLATDILGNDAKLTRHIINANFLSMQNFCFNSKNPPRIKKFI